MKRCFVFACFADNQPGFLDFSYRIKTLAKHYDLTIISPIKLEQGELQIPGADYMQLGNITNKISWLQFIMRAARLTRKEKPDLVVILHTYLAPISLLINTPNALYWNEHPTNLMHLPSKKSLAKYVFTKLCHKLFYWGAKSSTLLMPIGEEQHGELLAKGCDDAKITMIYMGVSESFLNINPAAQAEYLRLVYAGSICIPRGRDVMLGAMKLVAKKQLPVKLTMVGAPADELEYCQQYIKMHSLENHLDVRGRVPGDEIPSFYENADYGLCLWEDRLSWRFNPPTKLFEYLVSGLPVLASNIRTHTRYINNGVNGLIFDYNPESLAEKIEVAYQDFSQLSTLKHNAKSSGSQYLWGKIEPVFVSAIKRLEIS